MGDVVTIPGHGAAYGRPVAIDGTHQIQQFECGRPPLNDWLKNFARKSEARSARTFVVTKQTTVIGYYCLAAGGVLRNEVPRQIRQGPTSVPVMVLGRLAVDVAYQRKGIGSGLFQDAMLRTATISRNTGVRAILIHAIDDEAVAFYMQYGCLQFPEGTKTLFLPIETILKAL